MTQNKRVIAVTGGIGSGKSTVCGFLSAYGKVLSCDEINAKMLRDENYLARLKEAFPETFTERGFDKRAMTKLIFSDAEARKRLDAIAHPEIMRRLVGEINACDENIVFVEVPLLAGTAFEKMFSEIIVVSAKKETRIGRIMRRDGVDALLAEKKIAGQTEKLVFPDAIVYGIENDGDPMKTEKACRELAEKLFN